MIVSRRSFAFGLVMVFAYCWPQQVRGDQGGLVVQQEGQIELHSPSFLLRLNTVAGLRAKSWENHLTGRTLSLGDGPELEFDIGLPDARLQSPPLEVTDVEVEAPG